MAFKLSYTTNSGLVAPEAYVRAYITDLPKIDGQRKASVVFFIFASKELSGKEYIGKQLFTGSHQINVEANGDIFAEVYVKVSEMAEASIPAKAAVEPAESALAAAKESLLAAKANRSTFEDDQGTQLEGYDEARADELAKLEVCEAAEVAVESAKASYGALAPYEMFIGAETILEEGQNV